MTTTPDLWRNPIIDNTSLTGQQTSGVVAATNANQSFAVWVDHDNFNGGFDSIIARKFDSLGNPLTGEINLTAALVNVRDTLNPAAVRLPIAGQGDGLAVAYEYAFTATDHDIYLVR